MKVGIGTAMAGFTGLSVRFEGQQWNILLRRADFSSDGGFGALHNVPVGPREVARYLPNWQKLDWVQIPDNYLTCSQSWARDMPYQVNIQTAVGGTLTRASVLAAFLKFMAEAPG
jgi:hypothetical protein